MNRYSCKNANTVLLILALLVSVFSCTTKESPPESKDIAEEKNDEKFDTRSSEKEAQFVVDAISNSYAEIRLTELAEQRAIDANVKAAAIELNKEHSGLLARLKEYAVKKAISIPTEASERDKDSVEKLTSDKNFDKAWCKEAQRINKETIDSFEKASASLDDAELKTWADNKLPGIRRAHDKIMACESRLR